MPVGLFGVILLVGVMSDPGLVQVFPEQRRSDHRRDDPGGHAAGDEDQTLSEQQALAHAEYTQGGHRPAPIR